jgi:hypothetical protein
MRFKTNKSVDRALQKFRSEEIVVQDVAVQLKVLKPGSVYSGLDIRAKAPLATSASSSKGPVLSK